MFWTFLIIVVTGIILFKLGVLSVLVSVLSLSLKAALCLIGMLGLLVLWIQNRRR